MAFVVLAGLFEPAVAVSLYQVSDESVLRADGGNLVGRRLADSSGSVGFDGLDDDARFIARAYIDGIPTEIRCRSLAQDEGSELAQPPVALAVALLGTDETVQVEPDPAAPFAILQTGVPDGVPLGVAQAA